MSADNCPYEELKENQIKEYIASYKAPKVGTFYKKKRRENEGNNGPLFQTQPCQWMKSKFFVDNAKGPPLAFFAEEEKKTNLKTEVEDEQQNVGSGYLYTWKIEQSKDNKQLSLDDDQFYRLLYHLITIKEEDFRFVGQPLTRIGLTKQAETRWTVFKELIGGNAATALGISAIALTGGAAAPVVLGGAGVAVGLGATSLSATIFSKKAQVSKQDCYRWAQLHMNRSRDIALMIVSHIDKINRMKHMKYPVILPGQDEDEYLNDLELYVDTCTTILNTILEGALVIHFSMRSDVLKHCLDKPKKSIYKKFTGSKKTEEENLEEQINLHGGALYTGDQRPVVFSIVLSQLSRTVGTRFRDNKNSLKFAELFYDEMEKLSSTKFKSWVEPLAFIKLINELNAQLTESVDDLTLFLAIRNGESLRALEMNTFNFQQTTLKQMVKKKEDEKLAELNASIIGENVAADAPNMVKLAYRISQLNGQKTRTNRRIIDHRHLISKNPK